MNTMQKSNIRFTSQGDYACSYCNYLIPTKRKNGEDILLDWGSAEVAGMFCSESHALAATNDLTYRAKWGF